MVSSFAFSKREIINLFLENHGIIAEEFSGAMIKKNMLETGSHN